MSVLKVTTGSTTLQEAQRVLGSTDLRQNGGDAAAAASVECYVGKDGTTLVLSSNSEMGGNTTITDVQIVEREALADFSEGVNYSIPAEDRPRCGALKELSRATATAGGLRLGLSIEEVRALLGKPEVSSEHRAEYRESLTDDHSRSVVLSFEKGKVTGIHVVQGPR
jgi:hypothetical protein